MKYFTLLAVTALILFACRQTGNHAQEEALSLLKPQSGTPEQEGHSPYPQPGEGTFEHLVSDYESKDRVIWQKPDMVISLLGDLDNKTVADIGAGTGYFSFRMVPKAKKVIAIDIDPRFISFMDSIRVRLPEPYRERFESRLAKANDALLQPDEVDNVIMVNTYAYIQNRVEYMKKLLNGIAPDGQLLIIDFKKAPLPIGPPDAYKVSTREVEAELREAGFEVVRIDNESLDYQYIVLARKPKVKNIKK